MKLFRRKTKWLARLTLVMVLFTQAIIDVNACVMADPSQAFSMAQQSNEAMPCHQEEKSNANVCLSHCTQSDQISVDQQHTPVAAPPSEITWAIVQSQVQSIPRAINPDYLALNTGPPLSILFCSFLN